MGASGMKKGVILVSTFLEMVFFAGSIFGWASLVYVMKEDNIYGDVCTKQDLYSTVPPSGGNNLSVLGVVLVNQTANPSYTLSDNGGKGSVSDASQNTGTCKYQDSHMNLAFTIAVSLFQVMSFPIGILFDRFGLRVTRLLGSVLYITGALCLAFASSNLSILIYPGAACIGIANVTYIVSNIPTGNMFGRRRSSVIALFSGGIDAAVVIFLFVKLAHNAGINKMYAFIALACCNLLTIVSSFLLLPPKRVEYVEDSPVKGKKVHVPMIEMEVKADGDDTKSGDQEKEVFKVEDGTPDVDIANKKEPELSVKACVLSTYYMFDLIWFTFLGLQLYIFLGLMNPWLEGLAMGDNEKVSHFTEVGAYIMMCGLLMAPTAGMLLDHNIKKYRTLPRTLAFKTIPMVIPMLIASVSCTVMSIMVMIPILPLQYVTFILVTLFRAFLFAMQNNYMICAFPIQHYGKLMGLAYAVSGIVCLIQTALYNWAAGPPWNPMPVHILMLILVLISYIHPINIVVQYKRQLAKLRKSTSSHA